LLSLLRLALADTTSSSLEGAFSSVDCLTGVLDYVLLCGCGFKTLKKVKKLD
jgi:hypothetical protein